MYMAEVVAMILVTAMTIQVKNLKNVKRRLCLKYKCAIIQYTGSL